MHQRKVSVGAILGLLLPAAAFVRFMKQLAIAMVHFVHELRGMIIYYCAYVDGQNSLRF